MTDQLTGLDKHQDRNVPTAFCRVLSISQSCYLDRHFLVFHCLQLPLSESVLLASLDPCIEADSYRESNMPVAIPGSVDRAAMNAHYHHHRLLRQKRQQ